MVKACCRYILRLQSKNNLFAREALQIARETGYRIASFLPPSPNFGGSTCNNRSSEASPPAPHAPKGSLHGFRNPESPEGGKARRDPGSKATVTPSLSASGEFAGWELLIPKLHFLQRFVRKRKEYRTRSTQQRFAAALRNRRRKTLGKTR